MELAKEQKVVLPMLATAVFSMFMMFSVAYTNSTWTTSERQLPEIFSPRQISVSFDNNLNVVAENLAWSMNTASHVARVDVTNATMAFLGIDEGLFDTNPSQFAIAPHRTVVQMTGAVLGASTGSAESSQ